MISNQTPTYKRASVARSKPFILLMFIALAAFNAQAQTKRKNTDGKPSDASSCRIKTVNFKCPVGFVKEQSFADDTMLFSSNDEGSVTYFFVAIPQKEFDDTQIKNLIAAKFGGEPAKDFLWKDVKEPLVMDLETKYEKKIVNRLGYNNKLINFVSRYFEFNGKTIVLGYGYDTDSDGLVRLFEKGEAIGDNAVGCNAIAATLNSITKEKKGKLQYCSLSILSASE